MNLERQQADAADVDGSATENTAIRISVSWRRMIQQRAQVVLSR